MSFDPDKIGEVTAKLTNGEVWICEYDKSGKLIPIRELGVEPKPAPKEVPKEITEAKESITEELFGAGGIPKLSEPKENPEENKDEEVDLPKITDNVFRARLSSVMTDNMFDRHLRGRSRGKLDMKRLWKAKVGATNLFTQKQGRKNKEYNVILLVDESGSMEDEKITIAAEMAVFLAQAFDGLNLNLAIVGFNQYIKVHKGFDEKLPDLKKLHATITRLRPGAGDNNDYDALSYAYKMFNNRQGKNILLMLSDGLPAPSRHQIRKVISDPKALDIAIEKNETWAVTPKDLMGKQHKFWVDTSTPENFDREDKKNFHHLVDSQNVTSIGFGIFEGGWQIPNHHIVKDLEQLKPIILRELKSQIRRG